MRKTQDEFIDPKLFHAINPNPTKWTMINKEDTSKRYEYSKDKFMTVIMNKIREIIGSNYKLIENCEPMSTACSVTLDKKELGHISYNILFPDFRIDTE